MLLLFPAWGLSQTGQDGPQPGTDQGQSTPSGVTYAPLGPSGYRVPIPEIKMRSIIGGPAKKPPEVPPDEKQPTTDPTPTQTREEPSEAEESKVDRLPFESTPRHSPPEAIPEPPATVAPPEKERKGPLVSIPTAPEDLMEVRTPKKEVLKKKGLPKAPTLLQSPAGKGTVSTFGLTPSRVEPPPQQEWIPLVPRGEMQVIPPSEHGRPSESEPATELLPRTQPGLESALPAEQLPLSPAERTVPPLEEQPPPSPVEEVFQSPLTADALGDREVRDYLKAATPILEELSLLMTRVPSLKIAEFDPSKTETPVVPEDVFLKLDSTKRMLQVLDSKAFAIIPPTKYAGFHAVVRESITETHQACEAMMNFFQNGDDGDLAKIRDHVQRARELIQKTRRTSG